MIMFPGILRHDWKIVTNLTASWLTDRSNLTALVLLVFLGIIFSDIALDSITDVEAGIFSALVAFAAGEAAIRTIWNRLRFHANDGLIPEQAISPTPAATYALAWSTLSLGPFLLNFVLVQSHAALSIAGWLAGGALAAILASLKARFGRQSQRLKRRRGRQRSWRIAAAIILTALALAAFAIQPLSFENVGAWIIAGAGGTAILSFSNIDHTIVQYHLSCGLHPLRILWLNCRLLAAAVTVAALIAWAFVGYGISSLLALIGGAILLVNCVRCLAYMALRTTTASFAVFLMMIATALSAIVLPLAAPFVLITMTSRLYRRAYEHRWSLI